MLKKDCRGIFPRMQSHQLDISEGKSGIGKVVRRKNRKLTEVRNLCQCKTRIPLCQLFLSVQFLRLLKQYKNYTSLFNFSIILRSSSLENPPKLISARSGMESVMAKVISSEMASEAASEADSSPPFMAER